MAGIEREHGGEATTSTCCASPATSRRRTTSASSRIHDEIERGFDALRDIEDGVSVFGSARIGEGHRWYELCRETAACLAEPRLHASSPAAAPA